MLQTATTETRGPETRASAQPAEMAAGVQACPPSWAGNQALLRLQRKCDCGGGPDCDCDSGEKKEQNGGLHRAPAGSGVTPQTAPTIVHETLRSPGEMLDRDTRVFFESRFGQDFGGVRIHRDSRAAESARAVNALAYTVGRDIAFAPGRFSPTSNEGRRLLAHELTHTLQQPQHPGGAALPVQTRLSVGASDDQYEQEADQVADRVMRMADLAAPSPQRQYVVGMPGQAVQHRISRLLQRDPDEPAGGTAGTLDQQYAVALQAARDTGDWQDAAEKLNGFNHEDIQNRLAQLSDAEVGYMYQGAVKNPRVGPDSQVAQLTAPGTPRASTPPPASSPASAPAPAAAAPAPAAPAPATPTPAAPAPDNTSQMSIPAKLVEAIRRGMQSKQLGKAVIEQLNALLDPNSVSIAILFWMASHYDGLGELLDAAALIFEGLQFKAILEDLWDYATIAIAAQSNEDLDKAGEKFASAVIAAGVLKLLSMIEKLGGERKGGGKTGESAEGQKAAPHDTEGTGAKDTEASGPKDEEGSGPKEEGLPSELKGFCQLGSLNCSAFPKEVLDEVGPTPHQDRCPMEEGPWKLRGKGDAEYEQLRKEDTQTRNDKYLSRPDLWSPEFRDAYAKAGNKWPTTPDGEPWQVHHKKPIDYGGGNDVENFVALEKRVHAEITAWYAKLKAAMARPFGGVASPGWKKIRAGEVDVDL
jgi:hypothetical protein